MRLNKPAHPTREQRAVPHQSEVMSPGALLRTSAETATARAPHLSDDTIGFDPFKPNPHSEAMRERGLMMAPMLVVWHYRVASAKAFAKWVATKDIVLSSARLSILPETAPIHYFGTYVEPLESPHDPAGCRTIWGYSDSEAMTHMHDLCRGSVDRIAIVQNDLKDFVLGLKRHIRDGGTAHFRQQVLVSTCVV